ncbi:MBL fold metallo-hydrolase [Marinoscillum furvescens]|uniref:Glyoxylase-like metal-dependent hydrolase (Beta-lactamase superfamily II) n=1 Tax=Marinoscillum furvescens DSM 4134 TaxID=1122208 RepID=A0A3D9KZS9_MARFU|nr:MBL fold metallo-hydrolase [Marinoscillum furvescens]RED94070.1 glyoxylase-like metal-dependent hydrolase (beta-lactamase superfamily II) [Marinoscillum furvescens DSM 4134]
MIHVLDLQFQGIDHAIAAFLIETSAGPVLIETGPHSTYQPLVVALKTHGYAPEDVKHVLLTHIHFDHAGAAWAFAKHGAQIYVHPFGSSHMEDPTKLYNSAKMIYGDQMETLWGAMEKIPGEQLKAINHLERIQIGDTTFTALHTPGHAKHHIAWELDDLIFTGDVAGVKIGDGPVVPPCPPPDINLEDWNQSLDILLERKAQTLYLTHYGQITEIGHHVHELRDILQDWAQYIKKHWEEGMNAEALTPQFSEYTAEQLRGKGVSEHGVKQYEAANPSWMSVAGLIRYWKKKSQD